MTVDQIKHAIPWKTEPVGAYTEGEYTFALEPVHAVRCDEAGVIYVRFAGDGATDWRKHTVIAGGYAIGHIVAVRESGTTVTTMLGCQFPLR